MIYNLGIDLGGTNIAAGIVDESAKLLAKATVKVNGEYSPENIIEKIYEASYMACQNAGISLADITKLGIGVPGICDNEAGVVLMAPNLNWKNVNLAGPLGELFGIRPLLVNDANAAALGEYKAGFGGKFRRMIMITLGTGIGGGIIWNGELLESDGFAGEIGHMVIKKEGIPCSCGRRGCFECYASAPALKRQTKEAALLNSASLIWNICEGDINKVGGRTAFLAAKDGDETGKKVVDDYISFLALGIGNLINIFRPEAVILGGGVSNEGENLFAPLREKIKAEVYASDQIGIPLIQGATLGNDAGIIGAALA